ncbi:hypothetical protein [Bordetella genomosp. 12]|uniref:Uncharacterized protein n=1 Tax=Bordetella genomosp. 12 TaxID=463035 RepID=A0A261VU25_9BORD|nr:hypothetical protein [Bordetella genomosp. 12]OZI77539.1 hypothetical protein CAL22_03080 [Bordetella genomosp. 12]
MAIAREVLPPSSITRQRQFYGTAEMPMPSANRQVAGMPRNGRTMTAPGDPGVLTAEDDVLPGAAHRADDPV